LSEASHEPKNKKTTGDHDPKDRGNHLNDAGIVAVATLPISDAIVDHQVVGNGAERFKILTHGA